MQLFYTTHIEDQMAFLAGEEAKHCVQVLRHRVGDEINLMDGLGGNYLGSIIEASKNKVSLRILSQYQTYPHRKAKLHLAVAPTKNISRFEWFLEKATEIGIDEITPILCQRSERKVIKPIRLEKIILSAAKQSKNTILPRLNPLIKLGTFFKKEENSLPQKFIAHCEKDNEVHLMKKYKADQDVIILIGPEGDFSPAEIKHSLENGYAPISLGASRLRTETAAMVACHTVNLLGATKLSDK
jgi:16S rRNA (uracil1498-N3)-methyltransferase